MQKPVKTCNQTVRRWRPVGSAGSRPLGEGFIKPLLCGINAKKVAADVTVIMQTYTFTKSSFSREYCRISITFETLEIVLRLSATFGCLRVIIDSLRVPRVYSDLHSCIHY